MRETITKSEVLDMIDNWIAYYDRVVELCKNNPEGRTYKDAKSKIELLEHMAVEIEEA